MSEVTAVPEAPDSGDIGSDLAASWDAQEPPSSESSAPAAPATSAPASSAKPSPSAATSPAATAGAGAGPTRGPDGKFVSPQQPTAPADPKSAPAPGAAPEFKIPEKWPEDVKAKLQAVHATDPETAHWLMSQYEHFRRVDSTREGQVRAKLQPFEDLLSPGRQQRALMNMDDTTYVRNLIAAGDVLDKNPEQGLRWLAQRYGVDLARLANPQAQGNEPQMSPAERVLLEKAQQVEHFMAQQQAQAEQQKMQEAANWIHSFASQKDAQGNPRYPYFDDVLDEIIVNVQHQRARGEQVDVDAAYHRAVRMNDRIWLKSEAARSEASRKEAEARRLREIEDARKAGFSASGSGSATSTAPADNLHAELSRHFNG